MRKTRKIVAILATLAMLAALLVPMVGPAAAATTYSADKVLTVSANSTVENGGSTINRIVIKGSAIDSLVAGDEVYLQLPADFTMSGNIQIPASVEGNDNDVTGIEVIGTGSTTFSDANRIGIRVSTVDDVYSNVPYIFVNITKLVVPGGASGDVKVKAEAETNSGFSNSEVLIARVGTGQVTLGLDKVVLITSAGGTIDTLQVKETLKGDLEASTESLKVKLPNGFTWDLTNVNPPERVWGNLDITPNNLHLSTTDSGRTLVVGVDQASTEASYLRISGLGIDVDETVAKYGDVEVTVSGKSSVTPTSAVIAKYGDYAVTVSKVEAKSVQPGLREQEIGKFAFEEKVPGTIIADRTITLTLPEKAKWDGEYPTIYSTDSTLLGFNIGSFAPVGTDGRMIKATVSNASDGDKPTKIVFKGGKISVAADYVGDIALEVGGSAGVSGSVVVAEAKAPITATASAKPEVKIGLPDQEAADLTITEVDKEILQSLTATASVSSQVYDAYLVIKTPAGVRFAATPTFEVTGDVRLDTPVKTGDDQIIMVRVKATSSEPSTIKVSGIKLIVDRTVPEGDIALKIGGTSLVQNNYEPFFPDVSWITKVVVASCVTPHPEEAKTTVVFKVNDTKYTVNGVEKEMDAAPYIKDSRIFIPVRYTAEALGVLPGNILYSNGVVTLIKGEKIVQLTIGSNVMLINGASINMDVAPEIVDPGRTMLPFRWVARAFGISDENVKWDEGAQTVTMEL